MYYLILLGAAVVRRWIEYLGWRAMDVVFVMLALLAVLVYLGISVFVDGDE